jgi:hypothetical protein
MRALLIGALFATLIGCCRTPQQAMLERCTSKGCFHRSATSPRVELKPASFKPDPATTNVKSTTAAKTPPKPTSAEPGDQTGVIEKKANAAITSTPKVPASGQSAEASDPILKKAKTTTAAKMEDPASAEFEDMKRAIRKDTMGEPVDTICGHVKGKKASGEETGERPFLYLVKEDRAFIDDGNPDSVAATAYRAICIDPDLRGQDFRQKLSK